MCVSFAERKPLHRARLPGCARAVAATNGDTNMEEPNKIFPEKPWGWDKAPAKLSLQQLPAPQDHTARAWILNLIELIHW